MPTSAIERGAGRGVQRRAVSRGSARGFSLVEITIVVAIMAVLAGVAVVALAPATVRLQLRSDAREIESLLAGARTRSIVEGRTVEVRFDGRASTVSYGDPARVATLSRGTTVSSLDGETRASFAVVFHPDGSSDGGGVLLGDGARTIRLTVDWLSGRTALAEER